ncbi:2-acylglycerol O-acyltransferase 2-like isoform X1 [Tachypleus tridentatus]|uniref:2-acylglycerol O-acyltransferase 2-like isoform X1 n=1 Tax=Tachypleus tridentatus TaxID=6853 RepID=UPI003FD58181
MNIMGIEFAPLRIPIARRLQTLAVLYYSSSFIFFGAVGILLCIFMLFTRLYYLPILYAAWFAYDHSICNKGGRPWKWVRNWRIWKYFRDYFPIRLIKTAELDPNKNYILGYHPHGIMCAGAFCNFATEGTNFSEVFPQIKPHLLTLEGQFLFPFHRELFLCSGACSVSKESIEWLLTKEGKGNALVLVIGGAVEALDAHPGTVNLVLKRRKGFVRLALRHGVPLVPVFCFGENDLFDQVNNPDGSWLRKMQDKLTHRLGFSPPLFYGRGVFQYNVGYLPYRRPVTTVVGKPIEVEQNENPTDEEVNSLHSRYMEDLQNLFNEYKDKYGTPGLNLQIL